MSYNVNDELSAEDYIKGLTLVSEDFLRDPDGYHRRFAKSAANAVDVIEARKKMGTNKVAESPRPWWWPDLPQMNISYY